MLKGINKLIAPVNNRIKLAISRCLVKLIDDTKGIQELQVQLLKNEYKNNIERFQNYGFTSNPPINSEGLALFIGGNRDHGVVIAVDNRIYRLKNLNSGDVALYDDKDQSVILSKTGMKFTSPLEIEMDAPNVKCLNSLEVGENLTVAKNIIAGASITATESVIAADCISSEISGSKHTHSGVEAGSSSTGVPQ